MDKVILKFFTDILYEKGIINAHEIDDIYDCANVCDLENVIEKMSRGGYDGRTKSNFERE